MSSFVECNLSQEDVQMINAYQMGELLGRYRIKPRYILSLQVLNWILVIVAISLLLLLLLLKDSLTSTDLILAALVLGAIGIIYGIYMLAVYIPLKRREQIMVCTKGLLQFKGRQNEVSAIVIAWTNIAAIRKTPFFYRILSRSQTQKKKALVLPFRYQNIESMIAQMRQQSGIE